MINKIIIILLVIVLGLILYIKKLNKNIDQFVNKIFKRDIEIENKLYEINKVNKETNNSQILSNKKLENFNKLNDLETKYKEKMMEFKALFPFNISNNKL
jgi:hypothetical protein